MPEFAHPTDDKGAENPRPHEALEQKLISLQLSHSIDSLRDIAITVPVWAAAMCALFGGLLPVFGTSGPTMISDACSSGRVGANP